MSKLRSSPVWEFFEISSVDESIVKCKLCKASLSRGKGLSGAAFNTSNLHKHIKSVHGDVAHKLTKPATDNCLLIIVFYCACYMY